VPVVLMTAVYRGWRFAQDARESYGAVDYLEKPFHLDDLLRRVRAALAQGAPRAAAAADRGAAEPHYRRGRELLLAGRAEDAAKALDQALALNPFYAEAQFELARSFRARGDHFRAMTAFERAVELKPDYLAALRALSMLYTETGFRRKATETLERALSVAPEGFGREQLRADLLKLF
jgi:tetratricopeptide (TPR) repeat protein